MFSMWGCTLGLSPFFSGESLDIYENSIGPG